MEISENVLHDLENDARMVQYSRPSDASRIQFANNAYFSVRAPAKWFRIGSSDMNLATWAQNVGETGASATEVKFVDPYRTIARYHQEMVGGEASFEAFIAEARKQSKANWRSAYTAEAVNNYIREGFQRLPN